MANRKETKARPESEIFAEGMDVTAEAAPVDPDDYGAVTSDVVEDAAAGDGGSPELAAPPLVSQDRIAAALEALARRQSEGSGNNDAIAQAITLMASAIERMTEGQTKSAQAIADSNKRIHRPFNENPPKISVFNLRGEKDFPKARLKCKMLLPWEAEEDSLDREEIELLNLLQPGEYMVSRNDRTKVKMMVSAKTRLDSDEPSIMIINHDTAFNNDYHRMLPPLTEILRQMLKQNPRTKHAANMVVTMDEEAAFIMAGQLNDGTTPENKRVISVGE